MRLKEDHPTGPDRSRACHQSSTGEGPVLELVSEAEATVICNEKPATSISMNQMCKEGHIDPLHDSHRFNPKLTEGVVYLINIGRRRFLEL